MIGMGSGALISTYLGEKSEKNAQRVLLSSFILILILGAGSILFMSLFSESIMLAQGGSATVVSLAMQYIKIETLFSVFTIASMTMPFLVRNDHAPNFATALVMVGAFINFALDYLFIGLFDWGMEGAAYATSLAQATIAFVALYYFFSGKSNLTASFKGFKLKPRVLLKSLSLGSSSLAMYLYFSFVLAIHNYLFTQYGTDTSVASYAVIGYLMILYYLFAEGISEGMQPQISYYTGAKKADNARKVFILSMQVVLVVGVFWVILLNLFPELFIKLFNGGDEQLLLEAVKGIHLHLFSAFLDGFLVLATVYFLSVGDAKKSLLISLSNMFIQLPFLYFLPKIYGLDGIWLALPVSNIVLTLVVAPVLWADIQKRCSLKPCFSPALDVQSNT